MYYFYAFSGIIQGQYRDKQESMKKTFIYLLAMLAVVGSCRREPVPQKKEEKGERRRLVLRQPSENFQIPCGGKLVFSFALHDTTPALAIDSICCFIHGKKAGVFNTLDFICPVAEDEKTGTKKISLEVFFRDGKKEVYQVNGYFLAARQPRQYGCKVLKIYPHDITSYTQGLVYHEGSLYESTGLYRKSKIRKLEYTTGKVLAERKLEDKYFGEGIAIANQRLYQITWNEKVGFVYSLDKFEIQQYFNLPSPEGWGMAFNKTFLLMSDGSYKIYFLDTLTLVPHHTIDVADHERMITELNEMEWVDGIIYANVYQTDVIVMIDENTGQVTGRIDCSGLLSETDRHPETDVLNGIAYLPQSKHFLITGKNWPKLFEVIWVKK